MVRGRCCGVTGTALAGSCGGKRSPSSRCVVTRPGAPQLATGWQDPVWGVWCSGCRHGEAPAPILLQLPAHTLGGSWWWRLWCWEPWLLGASGSEPAAWGVWGRGGQQWPVSWRVPCALGPGPGHCSGGPVGTQVRRAAVHRSGDATAQTSAASSGPRTARVRCRPSGDTSRGAGEAPSRARPYVPARLPTLLIGRSLNQLHSDI